MLKFLFVGIGGFLGSISRYYVGGLVHRYLDKPWFPYGTLAVNIIGCLVIGFLSGLAEDYQVFSPETRLIVFIGFLGGFTTFSTFGFETFQFLRDGQLLAMVSNISLHLFFGLGAVWAGYTLSKLI